MPFAPGGGNDTLGRLFGQKLTEAFGESVVVENRPGAGTTIAAAHVARAKPDGLKFGTGGVGSVMHTSGMVVSQTADIEMLHVPYKGAGPAYIALMSGEVDLVIDTAAALMPQIKAGTVRGLAISRDERLPDAPDLPTTPQWKAESDKGRWAPMIRPRVKSRSQRLGVLKS